MSKATYKGLSGLRFQRVRVHDGKTKALGQEQPRAYHILTQQLEVERARHTGTGRSLLKPQTHPKWHISSKKAVHTLESFTSSPPTGN